MNRRPHPRIVRSYHCDNASHRSDFRSCPHCDHRLDSDDWDKLSSVLVLDEVQHKHGSVAIVAECPACFESSWVHRPIDSFYSFQGWPDGWVEAAQQERDRRSVQSARDWSAGLCGRCSLLESAVLDTRAWRTCPVGSGPVYTECARFKPVKPGSD